MEYELTIQVSEELRRQAAELAAARGATMENVVREAIAQYMSALGTEALSAQPPVQSRTELGARLRRLRDRVLADETTPLGWEGLERELAERRGERNDDSSYLR